MVETKPKSKRKKVLIVEDDEVLLTLLTDSLKKENFDIMTAVDGIGGLKAAQEELPDLIILDLEMPGMKGLEVLEKLRADEKTKNIEVMILSNISDIETISMAMGDGSVHDYLAKTDLELEDIVKKVKDKLMKML